MADKCPSCDGRGDNVGFACGPSVDYPIVKFVCDLCGGSGTKPDGYDERLAAGKLIREFREKHDLSLREAARLIKTHVSILCDCERGRAPLDEIHSRLTQLKEARRG